MTDPFLGEEADGTAGPLVAVVGVLLLVAGGAQRAVGVARAAGRAGPNVARQLARAGRVAGRAITRRATAWARCD